MTKNDRVSSYTVSLSYDRRLYRQDVAGSIAHARMLEKQGIISRVCRRLSLSLKAWSPSARTSRTTLLNGGRTWKTFT